MYKLENFEKIDSLKEGEVVMKLPGTDIVMPYSNGSAFVSKDGTVGYTALAVNDLVARSVGEPEGMMGILGAQLAEQLGEPALKEQIKELLARDNLYLFASKTEDGRQVITIPGMGDGLQVDDQNIDGFVVAAYSTQGGTPSLEQTYAFHSQATADRKLAGGRSSLEKEVLELVPTANKLYVKAEELMRNMSLF